MSNKHQEMAIRNKMDAQEKDADKGHGAEKHSAPKQKMNSGSRESKEGKCKSCGK